MKLSSLENFNIPTFPRIKEINKKYVCEKYTRIKNDHFQEKNPPAESADYRMPAVVVVFGQVAAASKESRETLQRAGTLKGAASARAETRIEPAKGGKIERPVEELPGNFKEFSRLV